MSAFAMCAACAAEYEDPRTPVRENVRGACEILGFDPLYVANEGKQLLPRIC